MICPSLFTSYFMFKPELASKIQRFITMKVFVVFVHSEPWSLNGGSSSSHSG